MYSKRKTSEGAPPWQMLQLYMIYEVDERKDMQGDGKVCCVRLMGLGGKMREREFRERWRNGSIVLNKAKSRQC